MRPGEPTGSTDRRGSPPNRTLILAISLGSSGRRNSTVLKGFHVPPILLDTRLARATGSRKKEVGS